MVSFGYPLTTEQAGPKELTSHAIGAVRAAMMGLLSDGRFTFGLGCRLRGAASPMIGTGAGPSEEGWRRRRAAEPSDATPSRT